MYDNVEKYGSMHLETIIFNLGPHIEHKCSKNAIFLSFFNFFLPILYIFHLNTWCESLLWHQLYLTTNGNNISYSDDTLMIARPGIEHKKGKKTGFMSMKLPTLLIKQQYFYLFRIWLRRGHMGQRQTSWRHLLQGGSTLLYLSLQGWRTLRRHWLTT